MPITWPLSNTSALFSTAKASAIVKGFSVTVTVTSFVNVLALTVIVASPTATPVIKPVSLTIAIVSSLDVKCNRFICLHFQG